MKIFALTLAIFGCLVLVNCQRNYGGHGDFGRGGYSDRDFDYDGDGPYGGRYGSYGPYGGRENTHQCPKDTKSNTFCIPIPNSGRDQGRADNIITAFAWKLFKNSNTQPNYALSPLSPQLLLTYLAWVANGTTKNQLAKANGFASPNEIERKISSLKRPSDNEEYSKELEISTAFFVANDMRLNQAFTSKIDQQKNADIVRVDFTNPDSASALIGEWSKKKSRGGLSLKPVTYDSSTRMALNSALYFKNDWYFSFFPAKDGTFNTPSGPKIAQMMNMKQKFHYGEVGDLATWAALRYKSDDSLIIILPNKEETLETVINKLDERTLQDILDECDHDDTLAKLNITMPKFKIESSSSLIPALQKMGIKDLFASQADLPYLTNSESLQVSSFEQQTSIDVNEEGTVLISLTQVRVIALSVQAPAPNREMLVDRPFIAIIANQDNDIPYVIAKVTDPTL